jgi:hypothetical protein
MRSRLRNWDSKITFFAFADVITSVCGMLIFITLLLATDLDRPAESSAQDTDPAAEQKLQETLRQQAEADTQNRRLQELLAAAETAPAVEKLDSDILRLRSQLSDERQKQATLGAQLTGSQNAIEARDQTLGLTGLKTAIQRTLQESESLGSQEAKVRSEMASLETQVARDHQGTHPRHRGQLRRYHRAFRPSGAAPPTGEDWRRLRIPDLPPGCQAAGSVPRV